MLFRSFIVIYETVMNFLMSKFKFSIIFLGWMFPQAYFQNYEDGSQPDSYFHNSS